MKKLPFIAALLFAGSSLAFAGGQPEEREVKTGWGFGILPCATYSSDMGFQYGAFGDVYFHGDGSHYPDPVHKISWEVSHFTKGRTRAYLAYDSKYLIPNIRVNGSLTYLDDPLYNFYGFNGALTEYTSDDYGKGLYYMRRDMIRALADVQGKITSHLSWAAGLAFWRFHAGDLNAGKYDYDPAATLYRTYTTANVLDAKEMNGGKKLEIKAGLSYDSRDKEAAPDKGIWSELYLCGSPDVFGDGYKYAKLSANWKQYIALPVDLFSAGRPVFAYRLAYQGTIAGNAPFYMQQNINDLVLRSMITEGFGSSNTVRGTYANRIVADGYAWSNFELRVKLFKFKLMNQFFYFAVNPFFDCGLATKSYKLDELAALPMTVEKAAAAGYTDVKEFIRDRTRELVRTAGAGMKLAMNENFIASVEVAHNFNIGLGDPLWLSIGMNYAF